MDDDDVDWAAIDALINTYVLTRESHGADLWEIDQELCELEWEIRESSHHRVAQIAERERDRRAKTRR